MIFNASGCLDALTAPEVARQLDAFVTKTVTPLPRAGNPPVRIAETNAGMLNSIGLANPGRQVFLNESLPRLVEIGVPIWVSVGGFSAADYAETCAALDGRPGVAAVELNLSCPNVDEAPESAAEIVLIPQPEKQSGCIRPAATRPARSGLAIALNSTWPALELRTRQGVFSPSSARAYVPSSSHQNASSKRAASRSACSRSSHA